MRITLAAPLLIVVASGCAHAFDEDPRVGPSEAVRNAPVSPSEGDNVVMIGGVKLWRERWEDDENTIRKKASFELNCAGGQLQLQVLELMTGPGRDDWAKSVGVSGCGSRAVYTRLIDRTGSTWIIESKTLGTPPAPAPQPQRSQPTNTL